MQNRERKNSTSLRVDILWILLLTAFVPVLVAGGLMLSRISLERKEKIAQFNQQEQQAKSVISAALNSVATQSAAFAQSNELADFLSAPKNLRLYAENRVYGKLADLETVSQHPVSWVVKDLEKNTLIEKNRLPTKSNQVSPDSRNGFSLSPDGSIVIFKRELRFDDQQLAGPASLHKGNLYVSLSLTALKTTVPNLEKITAIAGTNRPESISIVISSDSIARESTFSLFVLIIIGVVFISVGTGVFLIQRKIISPIERITRFVVRRSKGLELGNSRNEMVVLRKAFIGYAKHVANAQREKSRQAELLALASLASQVAHDIRSPLAALEVVMHESSRLPESLRVLTRSAIGRIRDISNNLLEKKRLNLPNAEIKSAKNEVHLLSCIVESVVSEKRTQFRSRHKVSINFELNAESYGVFANVDSTELKRILSNLVNNAVEAINEEGKVEISLSASDQTVIITIKDTGKGIPAQVLKVLENEGGTFGKALGNGLGLSHAKRMLNAWGGEVQIRSEVNVGTEVNLCLPKAPPDIWLTAELKLGRNEGIVILDDDPSIHQIWKKRFEETGVDLRHYSTVNDCQQALSAREVKNPRTTTYLFDYELLGEKTSGLDLIESLNLSSRAILVTSHYEEPSIRNRCRSIGLRMIPKNLAGFVPIRIENEINERVFP
jgi:signal transduction histidine kinase